MNKYIYQMDDFSLAEEELVLAETLFHNANGYIGVRSNFEEGYPDNYRTIRGTYLNGVYDFTHMGQAEKLHGLVEEKQTMLNVTDTQGIEVFLDEERFDMFTGTVLEKTRKLDMEKGITVRNVKWESVKGKQVLVQITRMTSFIRQNLFLVKYELTPLNFSGPVCFSSVQEGQVMNFFDPTDPRVAGEAFQYIQLQKICPGDDGAAMLSETSKSGIQICTVVKNVLTDAVKSRQIDKTKTTEHFEVQAEKGVKLTFYKYNVIGDSIRYADCMREMRTYMDEVSALPVENLYREQEEYLKAFWDDCALDVEGDDELQKAICYNQYQLLQSASKDPVGNIAAKGLSGEGYEGHYFWDTEMYMQPFFVLNNRDISRNLILFRYRTLDYARENARELGHTKGALYPWRTIMGKECSGFFPSGTAAYHINGDIAYSIVAYYLATKDLDFMEKYGFEMLVETARIWVDMGCYYNGKLCINEVTGPDEYTCMVNNNYYTNVLAQYNLRWAARIGHLLQKDGKGKAVMEKLQVTEEELREFEEAADRMYLPYDEVLDINPQDDSFLQKKRWDLEATPEESFPLLMNYHPLHLYRYQVCKQADTVMAHFVLEDAQSIETIQHSFDYYEKITTHDSSLSTCIFSIMAARLGRTEKAYTYFGESAKLDLFNTHKNTKDGIHTANMGGTYMAMVYGFGGFRLKENGISFRPVLPKAWKGYQFRILFEDSKIIVKADGKQCSFILAGGTAKEIRVYDEVYVLTDKIIVDLKEEA